MSRKGIRPGEKVPAPMSTGDRDLMVEYVFGDPDYVERLRPASAGKGLVGDFTLDELEDLLGCVAAEANHTDDKPLRKRLDSFFKRLLRIQGSYDDGNWNDSGI